MRQPYIYTLPEQFLKDTRVPACWRIYSLMNGFFVSGKVFYGTNEWIEHQIGIKQWAISKGISELVQFGLIECEGRESKHRVCRPTGKVIITQPSEMSLGNLVLNRNQPSAKSLHNSDSISEIEKDTANAGIYRIEKENSDREDSFPYRRASLPRQAREAYAAMVKWAEEERGFPFLKTAVLKQYKAFKIAKENGIKAVDLKERWQEMAEDKFWSKSGFDWMNVVESFNKKQ